VSNTFTVSDTAGQLDYCPDCVDVYGVLEGAGKRCKCDRSINVRDPFIGGDFPTPFETCWFCQAEIIRSGSRWSTYYCETCRVPILNLNDVLEKDGLVGLPIGRHTLMHARWPSARPLTAGAVVARWKEERLRVAWKAYPEGAVTTEWTGFAQHLRRIRERDHGAALVELVGRVQEAPVDWTTAMLREVNSTRRIPEIGD
jgi:hypothetical protein